MASVVVLDFQIGEVILFNYDEEAAHDVDLEELIKARIGHSEFQWMASNQLAIRTDLEPLI